MGVANGRGYQEVGVASGWNLCVVSECCKEVYYRYPHNNYYFPLLHLFLAASSLFLCSFLNVFSFLFVIFVQCYN